MRTHAQESPGPHEAHHYVQEGDHVLHALYSETSRLDDVDKKMVGKKAGRGRGGSRQGAAVRWMVITIQRYAHISTIACAHARRKHGNLLPAADSIYSYS
jgi:hypothetical protein